jgi:Ca-activated chloride channel family protein
MTHVQFGHPQWLWLGTLACVATIALFVRATQLRQRAAVSLAGVRYTSSVSTARRLTKQALAVIGVAATFVALARPLAGFRWEEERQDGIDLMFAVDTSKSMLATDLRPDRLTRAKLAVSDLLREFPGERAGLIAFAGDAFVQAPMTIDHAVFGEALQSLDTTVIARGGTNIAAPIRAAVEAMATEPDRRKILVLLSDGEDLQGEALAAARDAARAGLVIYTVGVGTPTGDLVPFEHDGVRDVMRDADGQPVHSRLDEQALRAMAQATGGAYAALGPSGRGLETLYRTHLAQLSRRTIAERMHKVYIERFQIPLAVAIGCLLLELSLGERRRARYGRARASLTAAGGLGLALLMSSARPATAAEGSTKASLTGAGTVATYNDGTAAYRKKDFLSAERRFQDATHTTDIAMQEDAYYDLGNARYRRGQASVAKDRAATIEAWKAALTAYDGALALQPKDGDARFNRDLVKRRLTALEEQQRQEQQKQEQKNDKEKKGAANPKDQKGEGKQGSQNQQNAQHQPDSEKQSSGTGNQKPQNQPNGQGQDGQPGKATNEPQPRSGESQSRPAQGPSPQRGQAQPNQANATPEPAQAAGQSPTGPGVVSGQAGQPKEKPSGREARRNPGALSSSEAEQLLDSVAGDMKRMPIAGNRRQQPNADDSSLKDW